MGFVCNRFFSKYPDTAPSITLETTAFIRWYQGKRANLKKSEGESKARKIFRKVTFLATAMGLKPTTT